jgi:uncharacterized membrane protein
MNRAPTLAADERGLIGKILVLWIVLGVLLLVAGIDTAQILLTRFHVADAAQAAAFDAAATLRSSRGDRDASYQAALQAVHDVDADVKLTDFVIDGQTGQVTVTVTGKASTLLAARIGFTKHLTKVKTTETSGAPAP